MRAGEKRKELRRGQSRLEGRKEQSKEEERTMNTVIFYK